MSPVSASFMASILKPLQVTLLAAALAMTGGCNSFSGLKSGFSDHASELREAFATTGQELVDRLKGLLGRTDAESTVDIQTAITLEIARQAPTRIADRIRFHAEAERLDNLLGTRAAEEIPLDSAVIAYLADLANGRGIGQNHVSEATANEVLSLCGPSYALLGPDARVFDEAEEDRLLRQSCFSWLLGDAAKARGLLYQAKSYSRSPAVRGAGNPFDLFLWRFKVRTGHDLMAHRVRLAGPDRAPSAGELLGRSPLQYGSAAERAAATGSPQHGADDRARP